MNDDLELYQLAAAVGLRLTARQWRVATAESCTGGWVAKVLTDVAGSSGWFEGGIVSYSNALKLKLLDVDADSLAEKGAVSKAVVREMAASALERTATDVAVAISGIAGPDGGSAEKPVGLVWFAIATRHSPVHAVRRNYLGSREAVRRQAVGEALRLILAATLGSESQ